MALFRGTWGARADGALPDIAEKLVEPSVSDDAGIFGTAFGVLFVSNGSGGPIDVTLPGVPDPFGRPGPSVTTVADGALAMIVLGSPATLGSPIAVEFSAVSGVLAGSFRLLDSWTVATIFEPEPPDFWDDPDAQFAESFESAGWESVAAPPEPFDFSAPDNSFSESFETSAGWESVAAPAEPFDFSAPDNSFAESFETSAGWTNDP